MTESRPDDPLVSTEVDNPFAVGAAVATAPVVEPASRPVEFSSDAAPTASLQWVIGRWTLVCVISAAPSFFWGLASVAREQGLAMILGVLTWILLYVVADLRSANESWRRSPRWVFVLRIGYWTRIVCSIIFPLGMFLDLWCGMLSVTILGQFAIFFLPGSPDVLSQGQHSFVFCYLLTLLQGVTLNAFMAGYMLLVAGIIAVDRRLRRLNTVPSRG